MKQDRGQPTLRNAPLSNSPYIIFRQDGASPLYVAAKNGHVDVVKALIVSRSGVQAKAKVSRAEREGAVATAGETVKGNEESRQSRAHATNSQV
jgi:ankyrin repeat protein